MKIKVGDTVTVKYHGNVVTGTVEHERAHSIRHDVREIKVAFHPTASMLIGGTEVARNSVLIHDDWNGNSTDYNDHATCVIDPEWSEGSFK